jgi:hypothetical protein
MTMTYGADSVSPIHAIPTSYRADRNKGVMLYGDGMFAAAPDVADIYPRRLFISATGQAANVDRCRILDVERGDASADHWPDWRSARVAWCKKHNNDLWPIVYSSIDPDPDHGVKAVLQACRLADQKPPMHWWIAWYTPGGFIPTAKEVAGEILRVSGEVVALEDIWGCQYADMGAFDKSVIYQPARWQ